MVLERGRRRRQQRVNEREARGGPLGMRPSVRACRGDRPGVGRWDSLMTRWSIEGESAQWHRRDRTSERCVSRPEAAVTRGRRAAHRVRVAGIPHLVRPVDADAPPTRDPRPVLRARVSGPPCEREMGSPMQDGLGASATFERGVEGGRWPANRSGATAILPRAGLPRSVSFEESGSDLTVLFREAYGGGAARRQMATLTARRRARVFRHHWRARERRSA